MDTTKFSSLVKRSKAGDFLFCVANTHLDQPKAKGQVVKVLTRRSVSGRGGYTYLRVQPVSGEDFVIRATSSYSYMEFRKALRYEILNWCDTRGETRPVFASRGRKPGSKNKNTSYGERNRAEQAKERQRVSDYFAGQRTTANPMPATEALESAVLRQKIADLETQLSAARYTADRNFRMYTAAMSQAQSSGGGSLSVSEDVMQFLRFSGLDKFPCTAAELTKGRTKMLLKLHPDASQKDTNEQMVKAMRGLDILAKRTIG